MPGFSFILCMLCRTCPTKHESQLLNLLDTTKTQNVSSQKQRSTCLSRLEYLFAELIKSILGKPKKSNPHLERGKKSEKFSQVEVHLSIIKGK